MPKKTRAIKVTDLKGEKPWLRKRGIQSYAIDTLERKKTFLIVCEGQTEELYFKSFPVLTATVTPIQTGCSKTSLVESVGLLVENGEYDEVWCVFDMDFKGDVKGQAEDFNNAILLAKERCFKCAYSNDAFELWFVLHYQFFDQEHLRGFYFERLSKYWDINYERFGKARDFANSIYSRLATDDRANQDNAISYGKKLYAAKQNLPPHQQNPVTKVYELVEELNKYLRR